MLLKCTRMVSVGASLPMYKYMPNKTSYSTWMVSQLEDAGCLFVKIGQWIAGRTDIFPADVTGPLTALQTDVRPMHPDDVMEVLGAERVTFDHFDPTPISCGSIAQVHRGRRDGREVAIKIQRPGLLEELDEDLKLVKAMLVLLKLRNPKSYEDAVTSLDDLGRTILKETDFVAEGRHMERFRSFFEETDPTIVVPKVYHATRTVLVMEYVPAQPIASVSRTANDLCIRLIDMFMRQFLEFGYVHSDLHAGNLGVKLGENGDMQDTIVMYDFGSVLKCPQSVRTCFKRLLVSYLNRDAGIMLDYMLEYNVIRRRSALTPEQRVTLESFVQSVIEYAETTDMATFQNAVKAIPIPGTLPEIQFRPEVFMIIRSFTLLEGLCKTVDPNFTIVNALIPFATSLLADPEMYRFKVEDDVRALFR